MSVKDFLVKIPYLCEAKNSSRWSRIIELQFDDEIKNENGPFKLNEYDIKNPSNRFETVFGFSGNQNKIDHCKMLVELMMLSHYKNEHKENVHDERIKELEFFISEIENSSPEISSVMSAKQAAATSFWDD